MNEENLKIGKLYREKEIEKLGLTFFFRYSDKMVQYTDKERRRFLFSKTGSYLIYEGMRG